MKSQIWRFLVAAIVSFAIGTAPVLAQGVVYFTLKNNGPQTISFKLATNCFIDTPKEFLDYTQLAPRYSVSFATSTDTCNIRAATYNLWFANQDLSQMLYTFNLSMWEIGGPNDGYQHSETCQGTQELGATGRYNLNITFNGLAPTCRFDEIN